MTTRQIKHPSVLRAASRAIGACTANAAWMPARGITAVLLLAVARLGGAAEPPSRLDDAHVQLERCHWPEAYAAFAALADDGDAHAARVALLMQRHGPRLFGQRFDAEPARRQRWLDAAAALPEARRTSP